MLFESKQLSRSSKNCKCFWEILLKLEDLLPVNFMNCCNSKTRVEVIYDFLLLKFICNRRSISEPEKAGF